MEEKEYFKINVKKYDSSRSFFVTKPSSLNMPKNNSVMFIQKNFISMKNVFYNVIECLIFWPDIIEIPFEIQQRHVVISCKNPHKEFCRFFSDNQIYNLEEPRQYLYKDGYTYSSNIQIDPSCKIFPYVFLSGNVNLGKNVYIGSGVKIIGDVIIGDNVVIKENSVIGADGLTTDRDIDGSAITMPQFGGVIIEDDVQIGANATIARGAIDNTVIKRGTKIDNNCFISHNCIIEENVFIVGESILFGSCHVQKNTKISGNSTLRNGIYVGENCLIGMGSVVTKNIPDNTTVLGNPARKR